MVSHTDSKKARDTRNHLMKTWVKPFGLMKLLVVDQGPEFAGEEFADYFREQGVPVHFTDGQSPWQNGPAERAGGAFKEMLDAARSGFSPDQRSLGNNVRLPGHMLADDVIDADHRGAPANDSIRRSWGIQDAAARACVTRRSTEACKTALTARRRK